MKRIIFTIWDDDIKTTTFIEEANKIKFADYYDKLLSNKKEYAKSIGIEFRFYKNTFYNNPYSINIDDEYVGVNLYKLFLLESLAEDYDEVLYIDFDVIFNTNKNFFEEIDLSKGIAIKDQNLEIIAKDIDHNNIWEMPKRCPTLKYFITKELLGGKDNDVINTGIIGGKAKHIKKLKISKRFNKIKKKIESLKDPIHLVRSEFYPNNEAIFSYILKKYKIPYQILSDEWHDIRDHNVIDRPFGYMIHFINKIFDSYYKEKTRIIFSLYIDIPKNKLDLPGNFDGDNISKSERTKLQLIKYKDRLISNKEEYAKVCNADFKLYGYDNNYIEFSKDYPLLSEYDIINLYKIYLLDELSKKYDFVLYLDFDVVANRPVDFFTINDVEKYVCCQYSSVLSEINLNTNRYNRGFRAPITKYWNCHAMLSEEFLTGPIVAFNTGIIGASSRTMKQLDFFGDMKGTIDLMTSLKEDKNSMYPPQVQEQFGYDNETIFGYKAVLNDLVIENLKDRWHFRCDAENPYQNSIEINNPCLIHFINKKFEWFFT